MNEQPEALRLAELLSTHYNIYVDTVEAAAELRRLHAENEQLRVSRQASAPDGWKLVPVEPVAWQCRMRADWGRSNEWWSWQECSREKAEDYKRVPYLNNWQYESRPLYTHPQNLSCKSTQARLATLWGYVKEQPKREPLYADVIQKLADDGVFHGNVFEIVRRIEEEHGIFKLRPSSVK